MPIPSPKSEEWALAYRNKPPQMSYMRFPGGFRAEAPSGDLLWGGIALAASVGLALGIAPQLPLAAITFPLAISGLLAWKAARTLLGQVTVELREGSLEISEQVLGFGKRQVIAVQDIRGIEEIEITSVLGVMKGGTILISSSQGDVKFASGLRDENRAFFYDLIRLFLRQQLRVAAPPPTPKRKRRRR